MFLFFCFLLVLFYLFLLLLFLPIVLFLYHLNLVVVCNIFPISQLFCSNLYHNLSFFEFILFFLFIFYTSNTLWCISSFFKLNCCNVVVFVFFVFVFTIFQLFYNFSTFFQIFLHSHFFLTQSFVCSAELHKVLFILLIIPRTCYLLIIYLFET